MVKAVNSTTFIVFLCGPSLNGEKKESAQLRARLRQALEIEKIEVILGEDDGLEEARLSVGLNAQDNELEFIRTGCNAVIIIADSPGAFCELGLFSWHFTSAHGLIKRSEYRTDCVVLIDKKYESHKSYINEGPAKAVRLFGSVEFVDFASCDLKPLVERMTQNRTLVTVDNKRGRPRKEKHEKNN